jgi:hypothetical protein
MYYNRKKKKPISIVDTYTKKAKYSQVDELYDKILSGDELLDRIQEFKNTNEHYLDLELKYINFLREYETHYKKFELVSTTVKEFYEANIVRSTVKETTLFFIKYNSDDVYFKTKKLEEEFYALYNQAAKVFSEISNFFYKSNSELIGFNYLFTKDSSKDYIKFHSCSWQYVIMSMNEDVCNYLHNGHKIRGYKMSPQKYWTERTGQLFTKLFQVSIDNKFYEVSEKVERWTKISEIPNIPQASYLKWYFKKLIDANNQQIRKIELEIRSRKRSTDLADNPYFVYIMSNKAYPNIYKIGWTSSLPEERAEELTGTSHIYPFKVEYSKKFKNAVQIEKQCHDHFKKNRVANNREFFEVPLNEIKEYIDGIKW